MTLIGGPWDRPCPSGQVRFFFLWEIGFREFLWKYGEVWIGWYPNYIGMEAMTVMVGLKNDLDFTAAYVAVFNLMLLGWICSAGIAYIVRTDVGIAIGQGDLRLVRKFAIMGMVLTFLFGVVLSASIILYYKQVARVYSLVPEVL
jgi:Na+-driven multidrug efflux pump